ncbi:G-type lectin S-receptor-like serine/threonine-protein kinase At2g19130 [Ricinus communis]|uniref:Receptor-like serine/threonine-protein kinase n=1 Tax=Ricinus communis TaxID=3988 RepID=B9RVX8_RICCO|nr:G-type lectin S-receptor-like serine/threonine-protein kinase At2g19130 [Ricinus communis]EEF44415.1 s-receptor kinase, putative [Ricinus communis]|eukprot:XP_002517897.1 G-type lectin S-receptor-like serine/threonine-protein kinase At2g19130 [Ricinus communis]
MSLKINKLWLPQCLQLLLCLSLEVYPSRGSDTIFPGQSLSGNQTLTSKEGNFELGFFRPGNSSYHYIGIWYKNLPNQTVVWVANREQPVSDLSISALKISEDGNLVLLNQSRNALWSTNSVSKSSNSTIAILLDNGNFVVRDASNSSMDVLWQSFDHPTDTWLPGGKLGYNKLTNQRQFLVSWRSLQNPAPSLFSLEIEQNGTSHILMWNGSQMYWTSGVWTGKIFSLVPEIQLNYYVTNLTYVSNENESYFTYASAIPSAFTRFMIDSGGQLRQFVWRKNFPDWALFWTRPTQQCEVYAYCGAFSVCNQQKEHLCSCIQGFEPKTREDWEKDDHTDGCVGKTPSKCEGGGKGTFLLMPNMRLPLNPESKAAETIEECEAACLNNCSCNAFAYDNGCLTWKGNLFNLQQLSSAEETGRDIHLRIASSEFVKTRGKGKKKTTLVVLVSVAAFFVCFSLVLIIVWRRRLTSTYKVVEDSLMLFRYKELRSMTKNFSERLGEGGFGTVYKGSLPNSIPIAVKQLKSLQQGEKQFCTEVKTIGTIQHINLVRLRGFCAEASKRFLVYDYMPNGSLEALLFQKAANTILDWKSRFHIAVGTARGLAYLHEGCRDCIIHCDIKPENILLDAEFNPKVADLGLAKIIGRDFSRVLTTIRGTRGYLAPEWLSGEAVTPKADVFSYGMLLCEIISGRRNSDGYNIGFDNYFPFQLSNIISKEDEIVTLLDDRLEGNANIEELNRACRVACWCIQDDEKDRPTMKQVVQILEGVSEVNRPTIPRFLQQFAESPKETMIYQKTSLSSD